MMPTTMVRGVVLAATSFLVNASQGQTIKDGAFVPGAAANPAPFRMPVARSGLAPKPKISFDDVPAPCLFKHATALRDEYQNLGVHFRGPASQDGGAILNECGGFSVQGYSPPNFLAFNVNSELSDGGVPRPPEEIVFDSVGVTEVSLGAGSSTSAGTLLTLEAYDDADNLLDAEAIVLSADLQRLTVASNGIARVVIATDAQVIVVDDLDFHDDCAGDAGFILTVPSSAPTGDFFTICANSPGGDLVYLFVSAGEGPTRTPYGTLCLDLPPLRLFSFLMPDWGARCFNHYLPCDDSLIGSTGFFQFFAVDLTTGQVGISNQASLTVTDGGC
ncbi:MAG: hypothetical protein U1E76_06800 [Planctomycetota bacterium]